MKKKIVIIAGCIFVMAVLFIPIPQGMMKDGGTKVYQALTYKIVIWNRLVDDVVEHDNGTQSVTPLGAYHKTSFYWFGDAHKNIDELWKMERSSNDIYEHLLPEG